MRHLAVLGCVLFACAVQAASPPQPAPPGPDTQPRRAAPQADRDGNRLADSLQTALDRKRPGDQVRVVVTFDGPGSAATARQAVGAFQLHHEFRIIRGFAATMTVAQVRALAKQPGVFRIEEDFPVSIKLDAARADFGADAARGTFSVTGTDIKGCIVDTGADRYHEQLNDRSIVFKDFVNDQPAAYDDQGHGTHVASIAFGDGTGGTNADRWRGVAPGASVFAAKVLDANGSGQESDVILGIEWCVTQGVHIISMSLGSAEPSDGNDALSQATNAAVDRGIVVVVAAGNSGDGPSTVGSPGAAAKAITVGACADRSAPPTSPNHSEGMYVAPFSSRGPTLATPPQIKPDICGPGHSITAAMAGSANTYVTYSGTSMATPYVAGTVALALQSRAMTPAEVKQLLEETAQDRGPAGKDNEFGAGLLDAYAFVARARGVDNATPTPFPASRRVEGSVATHGLWSYPFTLGAGDLGVPIAASITIAGQENCTLFLFGLCFSAQWDPDLEARLVDPRGVVLAESTCLADDECGGIGRQETLHAMPTVAGTYMIQVFPAEDSGNNGKGGSFALDLSTGPLGGGAPDPSGFPVAHVSMSPSTTVNKSGWQASVTITLHRPDHSTLTNVLATVSGTWSGGYTGTSSCPFDQAGVCTVTTGNISKRKTSATFTVTNVTGNVNYQPSTEPTSITVNKQP